MLHDSSGHLFLIVGPSGAGKDSLIAGAAERLAGDPRFIFQQRVITRAADAGGEEHHAVSEDEFARMATEGTFCLTWSAHGLSYGIPRAAVEAVCEGKRVIANVSRGVLAAARRELQPVTIVEITAPPDILARRLAARGRETAADIEARIRRQAAPVAGEDVRRIVNASTLDAAVSEFVAILKDPEPPHD